MLFGVGLGIVNQLCFDKKSYNRQEDIQRISEFFDMSLYDRFEDEKHLSFCLKGDILEKYLYDFLFEQADLMLYGEKIKKDIEKLKNKDSEELLYMIRNEHCDFIHCKEHYNEFLKHESIFYFYDDCILSGNEERYFYIYNLLKKLTDNLLKGTICFDNT